ncbi:hypothetical protein BX661DRAFT_39500 [Kickxella alabastrina]|uniref:uncharacterized protein n=1 Tax=Kickxella alabastrina TaxID=61397 RepID=UPI002221035B|nr:uncharacterized protein BX661DRAFT_39500 [Kickxella alabastrina]KAI7825537.1 hypothetical protein BX661DRAFT_39500 [Kickxella alabastrina]
MSAYFRAACLLITTRISFFYKINEFGGGHTVFFIAHLFATQPFLLSINHIYIFCKPYLFSLYIFFTSLAALYIYSTTSSAAISQSVNPLDTPIPYTYRYTAMSSNNNIYDVLPHPSLFQHRQQGQERSSNHTESSTALQSPASVQNTTSTGVHTEPAAQHWGDDEWSEIRRRLWNAKK